MSRLFSHSITLEHLSRQIEFWKKRSHSSRKCVKSFLALPLEKPRFMRFSPYLSSIIPLAALDLQSFACKVSGRIALVNASTVQLTFSSGSNFPQVSSMILFSSLIQASASCRQHVRCSKDSVSCWHLMQSAIGY